MKVCPKCSTQNQDKYGFCIRCGSPLNVQAPAPVIPQTTPGNAYQAGGYGYNAAGFNDVRYTEPDDAFGGYAGNAGGYNADGYNDVGYTEPDDAAGGYPGNAGGYNADGYDDDYVAVDAGGYNNGGYPPDAGSYGGYDNGGYAASDEWAVQPQQQDDSSRNSRIAIIAVVAALVLCLSIGAIYWFFLRPADDDTGVESESSVSASQQSTQGGTPSRTAQGTTEPTTAEPTTAQPITAAPTTGVPTASAVPADLVQYAAGLVPENRMYEIQLKEKTSNINKRSSPYLTESNQVGKLPNGTRVFVQYIYNGKWAVIEENGSHYFLSLYASNDSSMNRLLNPVD